MAEVAELMVRNGLSLAQAATELRLTLTTNECLTLMKRKSFQRILWSARNRYYVELASDPDNTKRAAVGLMRLLAQNLYELGDFDKAGAVIEKMAKIAGWIGAEGQVNVFAGLSQKDIDEMKAKLEADDAATVQPAGKPN